MLALQGKIENIYSIRGTYATVEFTSEPRMFTVSVAHMLQYPWHIYYSIRGTYATVEFTSEPRMFTFPIQTPTQEG
jgi:hypothetical protein